eukprot:g41040.t1
MLLGMEGMRYKNRLERLGLFSLEHRRLRSDCIEVYKIMSAMDKVNDNGVFPRVGSSELELKQRLESLLCICEAEVYIDSTYREVDTVQIRSIQAEGQWKESIANRKNNVWNLFGLELRNGKGQQMLVEVIYRPPNNQGSVEHGINLEKTKACSMGDIVIMDAIQVVEDFEKLREISIRMKFVLEKLMGLKDIKSLGLDGLYCRMLKEA